MTNSFQTLFKALSKKTKKTLEPKIHKKINKAIEEIKSYTEPLAESQYLEISKIEIYFKKMERILQRLENSIDYFKDIIDSDIKDAEQTIKDQIDFVFNSAVFIPRALTGGAIPNSSQIRGAFSGTKQSPDKFIQYLVEKLHDKPWTFDKPA